MVQFARSSPSIRLRPVPGTFASTIMTTANSRPTLPVCKADIRSRTKVGRQIQLCGIRTVLMDIEGTICSISFVKEQLYPYSLATLPAALSSYFSLTTDEARKASPLADYIAAFPDQIRQSQAALTTHVHELVSQDIKDPALKKLQGYLWRSGFDAGKLAAPLYEDVVPKWNIWKNQGSSKPVDGSSTPAKSEPTGRPIELAIYSSGSVEAQKMLLSHVGPPASSSPSAPVPSSGSRDLTGLIDHYFDTENAGAKVDRESYSTIATALNRQPSEILFLSDNTNEIRAALQAGLQAIVVERPGNAKLTSRDELELLLIRTFDQLELYP